MSRLQVLSIRAWTSVHGICFIVLTMSYASAAFNGNVTEQALTLQSFHLTCELLGSTNTS